MADSKQELKTAQYVLKNALNDAERGSAYQANLLKTIISKSFEQITDAAAVFAAQASQATMQAQRTLADLRTRRVRDGLSLEACWTLTGCVSGLRAHVQALQQRLEAASKSLATLVHEQAKQQPKVERCNRTRDVVQKLETAIVKAGAKETPPVSGAAVVPVASSKPREQGQAM